VQVFIAKTFNKYISVLADLLIDIPSSLLRHNETTCTSRYLAKHLLISKARVGFPKSQNMLYLNK